MRAGLPHGSNCFWRHQGSGKPRFENEKAGPQLSSPRIFEREHANQLSRPHSQSKSENAGRRKHRRRKSRGETSMMNFRFSISDFRLWMFVIVGVRFGAASHFWQSAI